jgi:hypothetical protein
VNLDAHRGRVLERERREMAAGIMSGGWRPGLGDFYRAQAVQGCGSGEVVQWSATVGASMHRLREL